MYQTPSGNPESSQSSFRLIDTMRGAVGNPASAACALDTDEEVCYSVSSIVQRCTHTKEVER